MELTLTQYRQEDERFLREIHSRQCAGGGFEFPFPDLKDPRFLMRLTVRDGDGNVVGALLGYMRCEVWSIADSPKVCRGLIGMHQKIRLALKAAGVNFVQIFVPKKVVRGMGALLRRVGVIAEDENFTVFSGKVY